MILAFLCLAALFMLFTHLRYLFYSIVYIYIFNFGGEAPALAPKLQPDLCREMLSVDGNTT